MNITMILEMAASAYDRAVITAGGRSLTAAELLRRAHAAAHRFRGHRAVIHLGANQLAYPVALFEPLWRAFLRPGQLPAR